MSVMISFGISESVVVQVGVKTKSYHEKNYVNRLMNPIPKRNKRKHCRRIEAAAAAAASRSRAGSEVAQFPNID
ncbi:hypothetical protein H5410_025624 [Solanum commersonii]|uniref:Uncharacterized protein n=1 Tax=Solanum commersonii TaxID=4109 RepID=A0A9J5YYI3_SOLCO|nr:hypothetical protein H5410_025624 [Solanum commersonii]